MGKPEEVRSKEKTSKKAKGKSEERRAKGEEA